MMIGKFRWQRIDSTPVIESARSPLYNFSANVVSSKVFVFGGQRAAAFSKDIYVLDLQTQGWSQDIIQNIAPSPRAEHSATLVDDYLLVFGGKSGGPILDMFWKYEIAESMWTQVEITGSFLDYIKPGSHTADFIEETKDIIFYSAKRYPCILNLDSLKIRPLAPKGRGPKPYSSYATCVTSGAYCILSDDDEGLLTNLHMLHCSDFYGAWSSFEVHGDIPRQVNKGFFCNFAGRKVFFGGHTENSQFDDINVYNPGEMRFFRVKRGKNNGKPLSLYVIQDVGEDPFALFGHAYLSLGSKILLLGGLTISLCTYYQLEFIKS